MQERSRRGKPSEAEAASVLRPQLVRHPESCRESAGPQEPEQSARFPKDPAFRPVFVAPALPDWVDRWATWGLEAWGKAPTVPGAKARVPRLPNGQPNLE